MTKENWLPVVGFEGLYEVSDMGRVRSLDRVVEAAGRWGPETRKYKGQLRAQARMGTARYFGVSLSQSGEVSTHPVHKLVLEAFVGPCPAGEEARHQDCDNYHNALENLSWGTRSANREDSRAAGTLAVGEAIAQHKLNEEQVNEIRASSVSSNKLAVHYPVKARQIRRIRSKENWQHV